MKNWIGLFVGVLLAFSITGKAATVVYGVGWGATPSGVQLKFVQDDNHASFIATGFDLFESLGGNRGYDWHWDGIGSGWKPPGAVLSTSPIAVVVVSYLGPPWASWSSRHSSTLAPVYGYGIVSNLLVSYPAPENKEWAVFVFVGVGNYPGVYLVDSGVGTPPTSVSQAEYYATPFFIY